MPVRVFLLFPSLALGLGKSPASDTDMTWLQRYRVRQFLRNSIWFAPVLGMILALPAVRALVLLDRAEGSESGYDAEAARTVLTTLAASMFTFIVFVSSSLLIVVQLASAQLSPRVIGIVFRDPITRASLTLFVFTFTVTLAVLVRVKDAAPVISSQFAAYGSLASLAMFLVLIDHVGQMLRPSGTLRKVGRFGRTVVDDVYPQPLDVFPAPVGAADAGFSHDESGSVVTCPDGGVVLAFDIRGLAALAQRVDCVIEMVPQVGDAVAEGDTLFRVRGKLTPETARALCQSVALGQERTVEQDPRFVFRILVDIASKGLSPAINDPTTAVLAIDQIHHLLRRIGGRWLDEGCVRDTVGRPRFVYRTPDWEDFVQLAVTEIRQFGGQSIQVARRLRAMLESLCQILPADRAEPLRRELQVLRESTQRQFLEPQDRAAADVSDSQGVGASHGPSRRPGPKPLTPTNQ
jgi:uncharacterized membrane protein